MEQLRKEVGKMPGSTSYEVYVGTSDAKVVGDRHLEPGDIGNTTDCRKVLHLGDTELIKKIFTFIKTVNADLIDTKLGVLRSHDLNLLCEVGNGTCAVRMEVPLMA